MALVCEGWCWQDLWTWTYWLGPRNHFFALQLIRSSPGSVHRRGGCGAAVCHPAGHVHRVPDEEEGRGLLPAGRAQTNATHLLLLTQRQGDLRLIHPHRTHNRTHSLTHSLIQFSLFFVFLFFVSSHPHTLQDSPTHPFLSFFPPPPSLSLSLLTQMYSLK